VKGGHLLHFDAQGVPRIDLEHQQSVLGDLPRRDGATGREEGAVGGGGGAFSVVNCEFIVWGRRGRVLRRERPSIVGE